MLSCDRPAAETNRRLPGHLYFLPPGRHFSVPSSFRDNTARTPTLTQPTNINLASTRVLTQEEDAQPAAATAAAAAPRRRRRLPRLLRHRRRLRVAAPARHPRRHGQHRQGVRPRRRGRRGVRPHGLPLQVVRGRRRRRGGRAPSRAAGGHGEASRRRAGDRRPAGVRLRDRRRGGRREQQGREEARAVLRVPGARAGRRDGAAAAGVPAPVPRRLHRHVAPLAPHVPALPVRRLGAAGRREAGARGRAAG
jgi:hypothetical protein